jgi:hypothetical protein
MVSVALGCAASGEGGDDSGSSKGGSSGQIELPPGTDPLALLPARIRRLSNAEYQGTVSALLGSAAQGIAQEFVPDSRQSGFTVNAAQRVDPVFAKQVAEASLELSTALEQQLETHAPCADPVASGEACATSFIRSFGEKSYRRPIDEDEISALLAVYRVGIEQGGYAGGIQLVAQAMLQSASFLYHTELGEGGGSVFKLTPYELASSVSYLLQEVPPSAELVQAALRGELDTPERRYAVASSLLTGAARERVVRVVREWLGIDRIAHTAKDSNVYPEFERLRPDMERETGEFLQVLIAERSATVSELLSADWTVASGALARAYGTTGGQDIAEVQVPMRRGILQQAAFLSVFSHAHETAPVLRGVALMKRVACEPVATPVNLDGAVVPPAPDPSKTTRERFAVHSADPKCAACHTQIDAFGFAFEHLDGMGRLRTQDNGKNVDSSSVITGTDFDGQYPDGNALVLAMAESTQVRECFARHVFRAFAGSSEPADAASEDGFVRHWQSVSSAGSGHIPETLLSFISDAAFAFRRAQ